MSGWITFFVLLSTCCRPDATALGVWTIKHGTECSDERAVHWLTATNTSDIVHFIFAADKHVRPPAVLMVHSPSSESHVHVNCSQYSKNVTFRGSVSVEAASASYGVMLYQICDFLDLDDSAKVPDGVPCNRYFGSNLEWSLSSPERATPNAASVSFYGKQMNDSHDHFLKDGSVGITFSVYTTNQSSFHAPYYHVAPGIAVEITITVEGLAVLNRKTRVAPVLIVFSNQSMEDYDDFLIRSTSSDGPLGKLQSSFLVLNERAKAGAVGTDSPPAYIHLTPTSYACPPSDGDVNACLRLASMGPRSVIAHKGTAHKYSDSLAYAYYGDRFNQVHQASTKGHVGARMQFISLGTPGDGAYIATNYSSWSFVLSLGSPPVDTTGSGGNSHWIAATSVSALVLVTTAVGIWQYRKRRRRTSQSIVRIEPAARLALRSSDAQAAEAEPVEPFLMRKTLFPFRARGNRDSSDVPLLVAPPPPAYDSLIDEDKHGLRR